MIKITGLDQLASQLDDAQKALEALGTELGTVNFNPEDPASIEAAVKQIELTIDDRTRSLRLKSDHRPSRRANERKISFCDF